MLLRYFGIYVFLEAILTQKRANNSLTQTSLSFSLIFTVLTPRATTLTFKLTFIYVIYRKSGNLRGIQFLLFT